jgi:hypothetical protein
METKIAHFGQEQYARLALATGFVLFATDAVLREAGKNASPVEKTSSIE